MSCLSLALMALAMFGPRAGTVVTRLRPPDALVPQVVGAGMATGGEGHRDDEPVDMLAAALEEAMKSRGNRREDDVVHPRPTSVRCAANLSQVDLDSDEMPPRPRRLV